MMRRWYVLLITVFMVAWGTIACADPNIDACYTYLKSSDYPRAIESGKKAVRSAPRSVDSHYCLGDAYYNSGELPAALQEMRQAEELASDKLSLMYIYNRLGLILNSMGDMEQAQQQHNRYLSLAREMDKRDDEATALNNIASIYLSKGQYDLALQRYEESLKLKTNEENRGSTYNNIAITYSKKGEYDKSIQYFNDAIAIAERTGDYHGLAIRLLNLGDIYRRVKAYDDAASSLFDGLEKIRKVQDAYWEGMAHRYISWLYSDMGNIPLARKWMKAAVDIFTRIGAQSGAQYARADLDRLMQPRPYAGIEIGSKGVKSAVLVMTPQPDNTYDVKETYRRTINTSIYAGVKERGAFDPPAIEETAKAVKIHCDTVTADHNVSATNIYLVGSSALAKASNRDQLAARVKELTGLELEFITKDDEVLYNVVGSIPMDKVAKALSVDVGSGNTKIGYLDRSDGKDSVVAAEIPLGAVSLTEVAIKSGDTPKALSDAADKAIKEELVPKLRQEMQKRPGYRNRRPVYLAGGIVWAIATYTKSGNDQAYVKITPTDIDAFIAGVLKNPEAYLNPSLVTVKDADARQWAEKQMQSVRDTFTPENLISGSKLLKSIYTEMKIKEGYFARWGSWLAGRVYLQAYEAEEQVVGRQ